MDARIVVLPTSWDDEAMRLWWLALGLASCSSSDFAVGDPSDTDDAAVEGDASSDGIVNDAESDTIAGGDGTTGEAGGDAASPPRPESAACPGSAPFCF